ncbi:MAG: tyrosine-type recombinase/integrase [Proteobacteria bacterium]|nr:tyrosine-type recombinase/integrase [Pseudomonadota bacterium]
MPLTDTRIRQAKPKKKAYKLTDAGGLHIEIRPTGAKLWRLRYRLAKKENLFAIGRYPELTLSDAREERDAAKKIIKAGIHPSHKRKLERIHQFSDHANTFNAVADEWLERNAEKWTERTYKQRQKVLEVDVRPFIGSLPVRQVTPAHVLDILMRVEKRAPTVAVITNQCIGAICRHAVVTLRADIDPTAPIRGSLKQRQVQHSKHLGASELSGFLQALEEYPGQFGNKTALQLMLLTLVRTVELMQAKWEEFDLDNGLWIIPAERMKNRKVHRVPLPIQGIDLLNRLQGVSGHREFLFPNRSDPRRPASLGVLWKAVASMGYKGKFSPHGIRATASTMLNEMGYREDVIETQLAHAERNKVRASYNQADYLDERRQMMQQWADFLNSQKDGDKVVTLRKSSA